MQVVAVFDTPSIKQYVFGTDTLREIRGASAMLDRLNRIDTHRVLTRNLPSNVSINEVYSNGGSAQFIFQHTNADTVRVACEHVTSHFMHQTAGEVTPVFGVAELSGENDYQWAIQNAHFELRSRREMMAATSATPLIPLMTECSSASHLPATGLFSIGADEPKGLSESSRIKEQRGRAAREHGMWADWMKRLGASGPWPDNDQWDRLRCDNNVEIGDRASGLSGYVGLVYADGNAMGRIVQRLNGPQVCRAFSTIVDGSIRTACFEALEETCAKEIETVRESTGNNYNPLPADILLLGGDDLMVVLPADRALQFAGEATRRFRDLTERAIANNSDPDVKTFFMQVGVSQLTISSGVAIARSTYPFYLLLDLAEELLKSAKLGGIIAETTGRSESHIDFHIVAGANSYSLKQTRCDDYHVKSDFVRTLRPFTVNHLEHLQQSIHGLRSVNFPRSKLHALHEAALLENPVQAERLIRDIFGRCKVSPEQNQRFGLWKALSNLLPEGWTFDFPAFRRDGRRALAVSDVVETMDLL